MTDTTGPSPYDHPRTIISGVARVMYADTIAIRGETLLPPGWVLPGGARTEIDWVARECAQRMDSLMRAMGQHGVRVKTPDGAQQ